MGWAALGRFYAVNSAGASHRGRLASLPRVLRRDRRNASESKAGQ
jgi:hypothetical protein